MTRSRADRIVAILALTVAVAAASPWARSSPAAGRADSSERTPVVVELFTSQGCSSCPPADAVLARLAATQPVAGVEIVALSEHVDYWNHLGWRDPFSSAAFSLRQLDYALKVFNTDNIYTPQMIVGGAAGLVGSDYRLATAAVAKAAQAPRLHVILTLERTAAQRSTIATTQVAATPGASLDSPAEVMLAIAEDGLWSQVRRGENAGRHLSHTAVVRSMTTAGRIAPGAMPWSTTASLKLSREWNLDRSRVIALVQDRATRRILGVATAALSVHTP